MRFLRALRFFLARIPWHAKPDWQPVDAEALNRFMRSSPGRKLMAILTAEIIEANERATMSQGKVFECGVAAGFRAIVGYLQAFSAQPPPDSQAGDTEEVGDLDHLAP